MLNNWHLQWLPGVQIHNWGETHDSEEPNFEFVYPTSMAVVIDGKRTDLDVSNMPVSGQR